MMSPDERRHAENCVINASRTIGMAARICAIAFGLLALLSIAGTIVLARDFIASGGTTTMAINGYDASGWAGISYSLILAATTAVLAATFRTVFRFCDAIQRYETPFRRNNAKMLKRTAYGIIAASVAWGLGTSAIEFAFGAPIGDATNVLWVWAGVIVLFIAHVFEYGCALQEQDDELL